MSKQRKAEKEAYRLLLEKHQQKHPGCKLNERKCRVGIAEDCSDIADDSEFLRGSHRCKRCAAVISNQYYYDVVAKRGENR